MTRPRYFARLALGLCLAWSGSAAALGVHAGEQAKAAAPEREAVNWPSSSALQVQSVHTIKIGTDAKGAPTYEYTKADAVDVQRRGEARTQALAAGAFVGAQDTLITPADRILQIRFSDGTLMVLGRASRLCIADRFVAGGGVHTVLTLYQGIVRLKVSALTARGGLQVHTPVASVRVAEPCGFIVQHRPPVRAGEGACASVSMLGGQAAVRPANTKCDDAPLDLRRRGEQLHICEGSGREPVRERATDEELHELAREVPFLFDGQAWLKEEPELPAPIASLETANHIALAPELPGALPPPPVLDGTPPFQFTPTSPDFHDPIREVLPPALTPTNHISPSGP
ncbi:MAG: FecR family protein [Planctomycetes bacterium]|nr:FecR family protein [Planctomycetota bacterium]